MPQLLVTAIALPALRGLTDHEAVELHLAACEAADLGLTPVEARALLRRQ